MLCHYINTYFILKLPLNCLVCKMDLLILKYFGKLYILFIYLHLKLTTFSNQIPHIHTNVYTISYSVTIIPIIINKYLTNYACPTLCALWSMNILKSNLHNIDTKLWSSIMLNYNIRIQIRYTG